MLNQLLENFGVQVPVYQKNSITPTIEIENICGIEVPFYGELLDTEISIYRQSLNCQKDLVERLGFAMVESGCAMSYSVNQFILALRKKNVKISTVSIVETPWEALGFDKLQELAKKLEVQEFISTIEPDDTLQNIVIEYFSVWAINGIGGDSGLEKANNVLKRIPVIKESDVSYKEIDSEAILSKVGLTWAQLEVLEEISDQDFLRRVVILLRTGRADFNPFQYLLSQQKLEVRALFDQEFSGVPKSPVEPMEPVHINENVEIEPGEGNEKEDLQEEENLEEKPLVTRKRTVNPVK